MSGQRVSPVHSEVDHADKWLGGTWSRASNVTLLREPVARVWSFYAYLRAYIYRLRRAGLKDGFTPAGLDEIESRESRATSRPPAKYATLADVMDQVGLPHGWKDVSRRQCA